MKKITIIDCSENIHNEVDDIVNFLTNHFKAVDTKFDRLKVSDLRVVSCKECKGCPKTKEDEELKCILEKEMSYVIDKIESSDSYIIISDTSSLLGQNKVYDKFSKRLVAYYYWPTGSRKQNPTGLDKKSVLINYNSSNFFRNMSFSISKDKMIHSSTAIGAEVIDTMMMQPSTDVVEKYKTRLTNMTNKLILL